MRHLLLAKGLWKYVDGSEVLAEDADDGTRTQYREKSQKAFSTLVMAISTPQLYLVTSCDRPQNVWDALRRHFERDTLANKLFLKKKYFRKEMKEGTPMESHLKEMKEITDKLASIGTPISEEDQVVTLLGSVPSSYSTLVTALEARVDDIRLDFVQQSLIQEELKRKGAAVDDATRIQQDAALVGVQKRERSRQWKPPICWKCNEAGHVQRFCPRNLKSDHKAKTAEEIHSDCNDGVFAAGGDLPQMGKWLVDSGASSHMTSQSDYLMNYRTFDTPERVGLGDGRVVEALGVGNIRLKMLFKMSDPKRAVLYDVLYVPKLACNLFSVRAAVSKGNTVRFEQSKCWIRRRTGRLEGMGSLVGKLYQLDCEPITEEQASPAWEEKSDVNLWHQRLGHLSEGQLSDIVRKELVTGIKLPKVTKLFFCQGCVEGKMNRKPFKSSSTRSTRKLELVHSDVCGPMQTESLGGQKYFLTFIDDYSRCCAVYFLKKKSEVFEKFKEFEADVTNQCGHGIGTLRTDNGGEYLSKEFQAYLISKGTSHELTIPHTPQQNGVAERMNRTLQESARAMLAHAGLPNGYWAEAVSTAAYLRNRAATSALQDKTPFEMWYEKRPDVSHLRVFGCVAYAHVPDCERKKLDKKAKKLRFVGYCKTSKGYRLYDESTRKLVKSRDVVFNEADFALVADEKKKEAVDVELELTMSEGDVDETEDGAQQPVDEPRRSQRERRPLIRFGFDEFADAARVDHVVLNVCQVKEPTTIEEALASEHSKQWKEAADSEFESLMDNETWELVNLPKGREAIGCKWVFKLKYTSDGEVERFKGRLVAKGYSQKHGLDYDETFSPVVRSPSIRALLAYAVQNKMVIHQMDAITAFLNGELEEEIYMRQPEGYVVPGKEHMVCKLKKSLYGLKQAPRCWNKALHDHMEQIGFKRSTSDPCVYIQAKSSVAIVAVYVDDLIIITTTPEETEKVKESLEKKFRMKDMGRLHYCLGISVVQDDDRKCIWLHQKQYILNMLSRYGMSEANPAPTPADVNVKLVKNDGVSKEVDPVMYQSMVGSLLYAAMATRPDIAHAVGVVSKFNSNPTEAHLTAVKRILRYLKGTIDLALRFNDEPGSLIGYSDADWAGDLDDRHSTTGNLFLLAGGAVSWLSKKQPVVALSTCEAEYVALSLATQEAVWLRRMLTELGASPECVLLMEDNQGAIALAKNPVAHARTKHIDIRYHHIREAIQSGMIDVQYCPTSEMNADLLTKPLPKGLFQKFRVALGMDTLSTVQSSN